MSSPTADTISAAGAFFASAIFGAFLTALLTYPANCSEVLAGGDCKTVFGTYVFNEKDATVTSVVVGLFLGGVCAGIASSINDRHRHAADQMEQAEWLARQARKGDGD